MIYTIEEITEKIRPIAERHNLKEVYLFGSYARGDATEESDVDLLFEPIGRHGLFWLSGLYNELSDALQKEVDLVDKNALEQNRGKSLGGRFVEEVELDRRRII